MNIIVLIDKFKSTISSIELGKITKSTLEKKGHNVDYFPISDGGNGFLQTIMFNKNVKKKYTYVNDALNNKIRALYLMDNQNVYIEVAKIIGINKQNKYDIFNASTYGVGQVILDAIKKGGTNFFIGLGGSITNDGGKGMLEALGYHFLKDKIIDNCKVDLSKIHFNIVSDVTNPLLGKNGATYTFSKQKGAKNTDFKKLEKRMESYHYLIKNYLKKDYSNYQGSGAAGGLGYAFISVLNASYIKGIDYTLSYLKIDEIIKNYDLIITGEGKVDNQSLNGKIVFEILNRYNKKTIIVCAINKIKNQNYEVYSIVNNIANLSQSLNKPKKYFKKLINSIKI